MKKSFTFTANFDVEINEDVLYEKDECYQKRKLLLEAFINNDAAILELYKAWLLGGLLYNEHYEDIEHDLKKKNDNDILLSVIKNLPSETKNYFLEILKSEDEEQYKVVEKFFEQFNLLNFQKASFLETK